MIEISGTSAHIEDIINIITIRISTILKDSEKRFTLIIIDYLMLRSKCQHYNHSEQILVLVRKEIHI